MSDQNKCPLQNFQIRTVKFPTLEGNKSGIGRSDDSILNVIVCNAKSIRNWHVGYRVFRCTLELLIFAAKVIGPKDSGLVRF